jgi:hypothetical protein
VVEAYVGVGGGVVDDSVFVDFGVLLLSVETLTPTHKGEGLNGTDRTRSGKGGVGQDHG